MLSQSPQIDASETPAPAMAGEPYRFDERASSTGSSQADLAPVSPDPAANVTPEPQPTDNPMGASPGRGNAAAEPRQASDVGSAVTVGRTPDAADGAQTPAAAAMPSAAPEIAGSAVGPGADRDIEATLQASPETTIYWQDLSSANQTTTLSPHIDIEASALTEANSAGLSSVAPAAIAPMPAFAPEAAFAEMAAQMDRMMADMVDRFHGASYEVSTPRPIDAASAFDGLSTDALSQALDAFQSAVDGFTADLQDRLLTPGDALSGALFDRGSLDSLLPSGEMSAGGLLNTLFTPDADKTSPFSPGQTLGDILDADDRVTELLGSLDDDSGLLAGLGHHGSSETVWDHLNDFG